MKKDLHTAGAGQLWKIHAKLICNYSTLPYVFHSIKSSATSKSPREMVIIHSPIFPWNFIIDFIVKELFIDDKLSYMEINNSFAWIFRQN